jgi:hypothetical protein
MFFFNITVVNMLKEKSRSVRSPYSMCVCVCVSLFMCLPLSTFEPADLFSQTLDGYYIIGGHLSLIICNFLQLVTTTLQTFLNGYLITVFVWIPSTTDLKG